MSELNHNLIERHGVIYWQARINNKRYFRSTGFTTNDRSAWKNARTWRDKQTALARANRLDDLESDRIRSDQLTIGEMVELVRKAAAIRRMKHGKPSQKTVDNYAGSLRVVLNAALPGTWSEHRLSVLTRDLAETYRASVINPDSDSYTQQRQRVTAASTLRQARALFGKDFMDYLRERTRIPATVSEFIQEASHTARKPKYAMPSESLLQATEKAAQGLRDERPELYQVYLLSRYLGLRASEMAAARKEWIAQQTGKNSTRHFLELKDRCDPEPFKPKGINHKVPIADAVYDIIMQTSAGRDYFLAGDTYNARHNLVSREFTAWLRSLGWEHDKYSKGAHEMRKLAGADWYTAYGVSTAALWLGHSDIKTTYEFYSDLTVHPEALSPVL